MNKEDEFLKKALEIGGKPIKLAPSENNYLNVFECSKNRNKYQEDFELAMGLNPLDTRERLILNYGIEQGKIERGNYFDELLKAMQESYPRSKSEYIDFDVYVREVMKRFTDSVTN